MQGQRMRKGAIIGIGVAFLLIISQPFHPTTGLIPEMVTFITTVPIWIASLAFPSLPPLAEAAMIMMYLLLVGALIGATFDIKPIWGWFLMITLVIHHYMIYEQIGRGMGEIVVGILHYF
ncbi:MAG: hypothetical protein A3G33_08670 [Omnitrophica bacterium RIFCSPLOWO2_12_FULL_44_17]|uniref:Uncharacterized protein n=1 Tax=Candidatus Danuiimicrobium aquiferis TaxID=1801832 RepID=A0A1G1KWB8_9BACT|nr:MAG: hypothetical protein A3B72_03890 [Omnitrophica bacterium RIFCSPHIGHO2_02_FULL_45_28]OGW90273.1 MAG: hypothetical protein A3E74_01125 [Omnitrophica bacterium RIFCSPHIGHO2_12_FULL_44_12]OGW97238.1 MAG: hypothetical protein A3G33_08670 [Omnitrophica bacterium RIFCSPLOWO2_12_FULL_44_17]OGX02293.1 MAG: hypothetical protein A3J12_08460 [Omnitrophica bacterium RIFCSPLOWO2_02_FULL_44_11]